MLHFSLCTVLHLQLKVAKCTVEIKEAYKWRSVEWKAGARWPGRGRGGGAVWCGERPASGRQAAAAASQPELCLCLAQPQHCAVLQTALCLDTSHCTHHHHTSVGNTANGTHKITLRITCTWLAWLGGWVVLSESWIYILHTWYPCHILPAIVVNTSNGTHKVWVFSAGPSPVRGDRGILTNLI